MLPNAKKAIIKIEKLRDYCLNIEHPHGKHKAVIFKSYLGFTQINAEELKIAILDGIQTGNAFFTDEDIFGKRYYVDFIFRKFDKKVNIRTSWIIRKDEDFPRLTSCFIKTKNYD